MAGHAWGLAGHETKMKTDHPTSLPPAPDDPEIDSLLSNRQGSWTHTEGYTVCLRVYPPAVVTLPCSLPWRLLTVTPLRAAAVASRVVDAKAHVLQWRRLLDDAVATR